MKTLDFFNQLFGGAFVNLRDFNDAYAAAAKALSSNYDTGGKGPSRLGKGNGAWLEAGLSEYAGKHHFAHDIGITRVEQGATPMLARRLAAWDEAERVMLLMFSAGVMTPNDLASTYRKDEINLCCVGKTYRTSWDELTRDMTKEETDDLMKPVKSLRNSVRKILREEANEAA